MKPQTQRTPESEPGTPVIVKMGGNQDDGTKTGSPIRITATDMKFVDSTGETWTEAESASACWICSLVFNDATLKINSRPDVLASLEVYQVEGETKLFEVSETSVDESTRLKVKSSVVFKIKTGTSEGWEESKAEAEFLGNDVKIVFTQRNIKTQDEETRLEYIFSSPGINFTIGPRTSN